MLIRRRRSSVSGSDAPRVALDGDRAMLILQYGVAFVAAFCAALLSSLH